MKNKKENPESAPWLILTSWLITIFEFPAVLLISLVWVIRLLVLLKRYRREDETILNTFVRLANVLSNDIDYSLFRWKMFITMIFYISLILFMICL